MPSQSTWRGCCSHTMLQRGQMWAAAGSLPPQARLCERLQLSHFLPALPSISFAYALMPDLQLVPDGAPQSQYWSHVPHPHQREG